jgi:hypothetical protein
MGSVDIAECLQNFNIRGKYRQNGAKSGKKNMALVKFFPEPRQFFTHFFKKSIQQATLP